MVKSRSRSRSEEKKPSSVPIVKEKKYKVVAENIDMIPVERRVALCKSCQKTKGEKTPLVAEESQLVCFIARKTYAIRGPCSGCKHDRWAFVKKPEGY